MKILVLNPGSTSTKISVYVDDMAVFEQKIDHDAAELAQYSTIVDQLPFRKALIEAAVQNSGYSLGEFDAFSAIATGLLSTNGGVYEVNDKMLAHARIGIGSRHPGNLGPILAHVFAQEFGGRAFIVDASATDELDYVARMTGFVELIRTSRGHPLNQRAVAKHYATEHGLDYESINLIVVHLGGGISVSAHRHGRMVDTVDSTRGEGRMAPTRSGTAPLADVVELCYSGQFTKEQMLEKIMKKGGWVAHLGTADAREVEKRIAAGDKKAKVVFETTAYQIAKDIGSCAAALAGDINAILLTGGLAHSDALCQLIEERVSFLAPVLRYPGEYEEEALALGAIAALNGQTAVQQYTGKPVFLGFDKYFAGE